MKTFKTIILALCVSLSGYAQDPQLFENIWYLYSIQGTDFDPVYTVSEIEPAIDPYLIINENLEFSGEGACNSFTGEYEVLPTNELSAIDFMETGEDCGVQLHNLFEDSYFGFISGGFAYFITQDGTGSVLTMETALFGYAIFKSYPLSVQDFIAINLTIYPNPVQNELFLSSKNGDVDLTIKIFNIEGKLLSTRNLNFEREASIDVSKLSSGIYFLNVEDENGKRVTKKFFKE